MNFAAPHFAEPGWLWLAVLGPLLVIALQAYAARARRRQLAQIAAPDFLSKLTQSHSPARRTVKDVLLVLGFAGLALALARPQWGELELAGEELGEDIVFAVDCSRSMLAADVSPNRLERAKLAVGDYVRRHARGRVGLVAFAGQAFLQCPLTFDHDAFDDSLRALDDKTIPVQGTDIGRALDESFRAMEKMDRRKVIALLTDGEDLEKSGARVAETLARQGVVVFTIGVGTAAGAEIRAPNEQGQSELVRDKNGETIRSRLDDVTLAAIARATKGSYFPLGPVGEGLAKVRLAVDATGVAGGGQPARRLGVERFHYPLTFALVLLVVESLLGTRRHISRERRTLTVASLILLSVNISFAASAPDVANTNAVPEAPPVSARDFFNAGTRKLNMGNLREAEPLLQTALTQQDDRIRTSALYNLGLVRFNQGAEELKKSPDANQTRVRSRNALSQGDQALERVKDVLEGNDLLQMLTAYQRGRGAKRELKAASDQIRRAMEVHGVTLRKWQRALGDFQGAAELNPANTNAQHNAKTTERAIAKLVDSLREMQQLAQAMGEMSKELGYKLKQLRGMIPDPLAPPGGAGDDEEEEEQPKGPKEGQREGKGRDGEEQSMSPEEAGLLLEGFKLGGDRRLPMGQRDEGKPKDRTGKNW